MAWFNPLSWGEEKTGGSSGRARLIRGEDGAWDFERIVLATVSRLDPKIFRGRNLGGDLQDQAFRVNSRKEVLAAIRERWGGGEYRVILRAGTRKVRSNLGTVTFSLPGDPLDGNGEEIPDQDAEPIKTKPGLRKVGRVQEAQEEVELAKARAEKRKIEVEAGMEPNAQEKNSSSEMAEIRDIVTGLADRIVSTEEAEREERRRQDEERRHKETMEMFATLAKKDDGGGANATLEAIKMIMESQSRLQQTMMEAQQRTQESIEKNRSDSMSRSDQLTKDMNEGNRNFLQLILDRSDKSGEQFSHLMERVLSDKDQSGKTYLGFIKEAMTVARESQSSATPEPEVTVLDVVNTMGDRFLSVIEAFVQTRGQAAVAPDSIKAMLKQVADEVVEEQKGQKQLPAPEPPAVPSAIRSAFDNVLRTFIKEMQTGSTENTWVAQAQKTLPPEILGELFRAQQAGDNGAAFVAVMRKYGSEQLVNQVLKIATTAGAGKPAATAPVPAAPVPTPVSRPVSPSPASSAYRPSVRSHAPVQAKPEPELKPEPKPEPEPEPKAEPAVEPPAKPETKLPAKSLPLVKSPPPVKPPTPPPAKPLESKTPVQSETVSPKKTGRKKAQKKTGTE